ncbi:RcnB family protein [Sphingomonas radiodurans]|uniref:RcnB family protein n=1 Tax=Sphingomonas radiodurans TaxID=2890321 RepID=UPI001E28E08A|nr:RcnB family protein [Sphingomonas radiodurans]WBH16624.1 RcnB family protein [Sphingomonas radiodurans]
MFKKLIQATIAASMAATPMIAASAEAQSQRREVTTTVQQRPNGTVVRKTTVNRQVVNRNNNNRGWRKGQRFDRRQATNYRVVDYRQFRQRRLYAPARGQQWVRSGNDAILIGGNNQILNIIANALR